jgi:hypothetical protein
MPIHTLVQVRVRVHACALHVDVLWAVLLAQQLWTAWLISMRLTRPNITGDARGYKYNRGCTGAQPSVPWGTLDACVHGPAHDACLPLPWLQRGHAFRRQAEFEGAVRDYSRALRNTPHATKILNARWVQPAPTLLLRTQAAGHCLHPAPASVCVCRAYCLARLGLMADACEDYKAVCRCVAAAAAGPAGGKLGGPSCQLRRAVYGMLCTCIWCPHRIEAGNTHAQHNLQILEERMAGLARQDA